MKQILSIIVSLAFFGACAQERPIDKSNIQLEYTSESRGFFHLILVDKETIKQSSDFNRNDVDSKKCTTKQWKKIQEHLENIDLNKLATYKPSTENRFSDRAAHASLKVIYKDSIYGESLFDHGNPPSELKPLVELILSLAETVE
ncbi:hypothetical protein [Spongiivirga citrea]|uniref:Lipoprotein n=1 Tax=Spongiivirga citrea TaxID=1481457 RepID=A0A6M0CTD0_9FLAO|nr:hypothetical protein [Spongiivirga citrea]NER17050.1 hypothetical protein [Spongiivirga citrea]